MKEYLLKRLKKYPSGKADRELIQHSMAALIIRSAGAGAAFIMSIVVSRYLGAADAGYVFLGITVSTFIATVGRVGADLSVLKFISIHAERHEWSKVRSILSVLLKWSYIPVVAISLLICLASKPIAVYIFQKPSFQWPLFWMALSMPFFAGYNIYSMALQAIRKVILSVSGLRVLTPFFLILFFLLLRPDNAIDGSLYYFLATILNMLICLYWWKKHIPQHDNTATEADTKLLWKSSREFWIVAAMQQLVLWGGQFAAGIFVNDPAQIAQLAVARNTASLISFILQAVNNVSAPRFATMAASGEMEALKKYARNSTRFMTVIALPVTLILCLFPGKIMSLFGSDFEDGQNYLIIISAGQFINVATGSVAYLLSMSGYEKQLRNSRILSGVSALVLAFILTPLFGATGSAIATAAALIIANLMGLFLVKKHLGFSTISILKK